MSHGAIDTGSAPPIAPSAGQRGLAIRLLPVVFGLAAMLCITVALSAPRASGDLLPLWLAGQAFAEGAWNSIYAPAEPVFRMLPPADWADRAAAIGYEGHIYPFVYPPLWAWVFGELTRLTGFAQVAMAATYANVALMAATIALARRAVGCALPLPAYLLVGMVLMLGTLVGLVAILQNQFQIFVAFLIVLALERNAARRPVMAGAALALAASIKLYPALFALIWLATGERRAFAAFAGVGLGLGLLSLAVAGWPLHAEFLSHVSAIGRTGFFSPLSFSLDGVVSKLLIDTPMTVLLDHTYPDTDLPRTIMVGVKDPALVHAGQAALVLLVAGAALTMARAGQAVRDRALWPALLVLLPMAAPLAWGYYFISATAFAPALLAHLGLKRGVFALAAAFGPISLISVAILPQEMRDFQVIGVAAMLALAGAFLWSARHIRRAG